MNHELSWIINEARSTATEIYAIMAAKPMDAENEIQKQLQKVVLKAALGRSVPPIESAISICTQLSEGKRNPKGILDTFLEDLGVKVCR